MPLTKRDIERLRGVHPKLANVIIEASKAPPVNFMVIEGLRSTARQMELVRDGKSLTNNSRHLTGHAVDLGVLGADGELTWNMIHYKTLAEHVLRVAAEHKVPLEWGGNWKKLRDGPHFQLPWRDFPR